MPPDPPRKLVAFGHSGLLPQTINPRLNPDYLMRLIMLLFHCDLRYVPFTGSNSFTVIQ